MKITKMQLRKLIEGIFVGDTDGTVLSPKDVDDLEYSGVGKDDMSRGYHPKLDALRSTNPKQARSLAVSLGLQDDLTPYEELAVDHIDPNLILSPSTLPEQPREQQRLLLMRDPALKRIAEDLTKDFENYIRSPKGVLLAKEYIGHMLYYQEKGMVPGPIEWDKVNWKTGIVYLTRGFNLGERIQQKLSIPVDVVEDMYIHRDNEKTEALFYYLGDKLEKIAQERFNKEFAEVVADEIKGKSFPLALTEAELRRLVVEAFIGQQGAPPIKIRTDVSGGSTYPYTMPVRKVSTDLTPESLDAILSRFISDYDTVKQLSQKAAPGQRSEQYQAMLDRGYNMKVEDFLNYGGRIKTMAMSDDEENRVMALNLGSTIGLFDMDSEGLTGEDLVDAEIMGQHLLNDPKFADIGNVAVREDEDKDADIQHITYLLNSDDPKERSLGVSKLSGALNNDNFKERIRRKIDAGFKKALPHIKESILDEVAYQIQTYGGDPRRKDLYNGMDIDEFAEENEHAIMGTLGGDFTAFQEIDTLFDAGLNEINELVNYFYELSIKSIKIAIKDLIGAGLLKRGAQANSFIMTMQDYYGIINRRRGDAYVPSPNLPVVTEAMIRQIIREAMFSPRAAFQKARQNTTQHFKDQMSQSGPSGEEARVNLDKLDILLGADDERAMIGHDLVDTLGDYDSPTGTYSSYQDIKDHDQTMQATTTEYRKMQLVEEFENQYMPNEGTAIMTALYKVADTPHVHLYVTSIDQDKNFQAPGSEVVKNPEAFHLMAISTHDSDFSDAVGKHLGVNFDGDDMDAILMLLEKMAGDNAIGHIPEGYQFSPEAAFLAWLTQNNSYLRIYVDP